MNHYYGDIRAVQSVRSSRYTEGLAPRAEHHAFRHWLGVLVGGRLVRAGAALLDDPAVLRGASEYLARRAAEEEHHDHALAA